MPIICLDYGDRYVGVATTDPEGKIALRHSTIDQKKWWSTEGNNFIGTERKSQKSSSRRTC